MKFAPALAFVVATALTSSVSSKDELVRRREVEGRSGIQWANSDVVMEEHVDSSAFVRAPEWGYYESKGSKGSSEYGQGGPSEYGKGDYEASSEYGKGDYDGKGGYESKGSKGGYGSKGSNGDYESKGSKGSKGYPPFDCPEPELDFCNPYINADTCGLHTSCKAACVPKFCKIPTSPHKIHGWEGYEDDRFVKLGSICGYMKYVPGIKPRHEVEVCCEVYDDPTPEAYVKDDDSYLYDGQCVECGDCTFPQKVNDICCKIADAPNVDYEYVDYVNVGRDGNYYPQCKGDYPVCCKCGMNKYVCIGEHDPCLPCDDTTPSPPPETSTAGPPPGTTSTAGPPPETTSTAGPPPMTTSTAGPPPGTTTTEAVTGTTTCFPATGDPCESDEECCEEDDICVDPTKNTSTGKLCLNKCGPRIETDGFETFGYCSFNCGNACPGICTALYDGTDYDGKCPNGLKDTIPNSACNNLGDGFNPDCQPTFNTCCKCRFNTNNNGACKP